MKVKSMKKKSAKIKSVKRKSVKSKVNFYRSFDLRKSTDIVKAFIFVIDKNHPSDEVREGHLHSLQAKCLKVGWSWENVQSFQTRAAYDSSQRRQAYQKNFLKEQKLKKKAEKEVTEIYFIDDPSPAFGVPVKSVAGEAPVLKPLPKTKLLKVMEVTKPVTQMTDLEFAFAKALDQSVQHQSAVRK